jgi:hypothetical protein
VTGPGSAGGGREALGEPEEQVTELGGPLDDEGQV